jgi:hypothetical protein
MIFNKARRACDDVIDFPNVIRYRTFAMSKGLQAFAPRTPNAVRIRIRDLTYSRAARKNFSSLTPATISDLDFSGPMNGLSYGDRAVSKTQEVRE